MSLRGKRTMDCVDSMDVDPVDSSGNWPQCKTLRTHTRTLAPMPSQQEAYTWMKLRAGQQHARFAMSMDADSEQECRQPTSVCPSNNTPQRFTNQSCAFCEKPFCTACLSDCFACQQLFCSICSTINYDATHERAICLSCYDS